MTGSSQASLRDRLADEQGIAMLVALVVLFVVLTLLAAAVAASTDTNQLTRRDTNYKNALQAAEAGLQIGTYRLNWLAPSSSQCVGDTVASPDSTGWCKSSTYTLGNGSTYQYYTSPQLPSSVLPLTSCAGLTLAGTDVNQRCITSVGISNGVTARSQIRVGADAATPLFQIPGAIGRDSITLSGNGKMTGTVGTNGTASFSGNASASGTDLGPAGTYTHSGNASGGTVTRLTAPIVLAPVNPGTSATNNYNYRITNGLSSPKVSPYDQASSGVSWNASTRTLSLSGNASLTLGGAVYNFCSLTVSGNGTITIASGVMTQIYIDSPDDPGSGCASGSGTMSVSGNGGFINPNNTPLALQLYVYGLNNGTNAVSYSGNANVYATLYAPQSEVTLSGNGALLGAAVGRTLSISGNGVDWDGRAATLQASALGTYYGTGWAQCSPTFSASTPGAGC